MENEWKIDNVIDYIKSHPSTRISGLSDGAELYLLSKCTDFFVFVTSFDKLEKCRSELVVLGKNPAVFPYVSLDEHYSFSYNSPLLSQQIMALSSLANNECDCLILQTEALYSLLPKKTDFINNSIKFEVGKLYDFDGLRKQLKLVQYNFIEKVENRGQVAMRGDIIDIYPVNAVPYRLSFFDNELESIKHLDLDSNVSFSSTNEIIVAPNSLFIIDNEKVEYCKNRIKDEASSINLMPDSATRFKTLCSYCLENLESDQFSNSNLWLQSIAFENTIFDWLPKSSTLASRSKNEVLENLDSFYSNLKDKKRELFLAGECFGPQIDLVNLEETYFNNSKVKNVFFENFVYGSKAGIEIECLPSYNYKNKKESLIYDVKDLLGKNYQVVIFCPLELDQTFLAEMFSKQFIKFQRVDDVSKLQDDKLSLCPISLPYGIIIKNEKIAFIPCGEKSLQKIEYKQKKSTFFELPKAGDYVVHDFHGIGLCQGIQTMEVSNIKRDYIVIQYLGSDKFYLPIENADQLSKYIGQETPKLNKIGGAEFERAKKRVKEQMDLLAYDMLKIYYEREHSKGHQYQVNTFIDNEFASAFPYQETPDQIKAIEDINKDMSSSKIMDRLICGDVGYGKTEVAFRAAMTAINNGKQVVMLVPTTILSEQHYRSALSRFSGFGVKIALLNRFQTSNEVKEIHTKLQNGEIDLLIGTQKVLNEQIKYKNLGLLILDEEQRMGVNDKEKIKKLKTNLDVLSMSATPIPRTLNMALTGVRDISTINTPPALRKSIETSVIEYSPTIVFDAIKRELERNGQILVITDKIEGIENIAATIKEHFPSNSVEFAHARMTKQQLENISLKLFNGELDVLVATTLIENGIDLPNANTLIVLNADRFGLSQLYQLRGRVGRSDRQAYAYFCFSSYKELSSEGYKRLQAIQDYTDLGSGFKIAMRDLELRGAGTILGEKQSGHLEKVGYDMYCRLLAQAVEMAKGIQNSESFATKIDVDISTELPNWFISDETTRFEVIDKISKISNFGELNAMQDELKEVYGKFPNSVYNLMMVALIKNLAQKIKIKNVRISNRTVSLVISNENNNFSQLCNHFNQLKMCSVFKRDNEIRLSNFENQYDTHQILEFLQKNFENYVINNSF